MRQKVATRITKRTDAFVSLAFSLGHHFCFLFFFSSCFTLLQHPADTIPAMAAASPINRRREKSHRRPLLLLVLLGCVLILLLTLGDTIGVVTRKLGHAKRPHADLPRGELSGTGRHLARLTHLTRNESTDGGGGDVRGGGSRHGETERAAWRTRRSCRTEIPPRRGTCRRVQKRRAETASDAVMRRRDVFFIISSCALLSASRHQQKPIE